jgi:hypothetical protein
VEEVRRRTRELGGEGMLKGRNASPHSYLKYPHPKRVCSLLFTPFLFPHLRIFLSPYLAFSYLPISVSPSLSQYPPISLTPHLPTSLYP